MPWFVLTTLLSLVAQPAYSQGFDRLLDKGEELRTIIDGYPDWEIVFVSNGNKNFESAWETMKLIRKNDPTLAARVHVIPSSHLSSTEGLREATAQVEKAMENLPRGRRVLIVNEANASPEVMGRLLAEASHHTVGATKLFNPLDPLAASRGLPFRVSTSADILSIQPKNTPIQRPLEKYLWAELDAAISFIEMNPGRQLYFLARDAKSLGDTAKLVAEILPDHALRDRIHILDISRASIRHRTAIRYLQQEGLSKEALERGEKFTFFDTGFAGSIPNEIARQLKVTDSDLFRTQMLTATAGDAANPGLVSEIPNSRLFAANLDPAFARMDYTGVAESDEAAVQLVHDYAGQIPKGTRRTTQYRYSGGRWIPYSSPGYKGFDSYDGVIDERIEREFMEHKVAWINSPAVRDFVDSRHRMWSKLMTLTQQKNRTGMVDYLRTLVRANDPRLEAAARDFLEHLDTDLKGYGISISQAEIGLEPKLAHGRTRLLRNLIQSICELLTAKK